MEPVDIAVVIVHWNVPDQLADCLASVETETARSGLRVETVVVDNGSRTQRHREVVESFAGVKLIELPENAGYSGGNNAGIDATCSDAVLILNPDTQILPGAIETLWQTLNVSPHIGLVAPLLLNPDHSIQSAGYDFPGVTNVLFDLLPVPARLYESRFNGRHDGGDGILPYAIDYPLGAAMLIRRSTLDECGGLDENYTLYSEEIELCQQLTQRGWTRLLAPSARIVHVGGQSTGQMSEESQRMLWQSRVRYHRRWTRGPRQKVIAPLLRAGMRRATTTGRT